MNIQKPQIILQTKNNEGYYNLYWSHLQKADKYSVNASFPALSGLYELYYQDEQKVMNLLTIGQGWRSGIRSQLREDIEPSIFKSMELRRILEDCPLYCRYTLSDIDKDIQDVLWFLNQMYFGNKHNVHSSNRFKKIYLNEHAPDRLHWV